MHDFTAVWRSSEKRFQRQMLTSSEMPKVPGVTCALIFTSLLHHLLLHFICGIRDGPLALWAVDLLRISVVSVHIISSHTTFLDFLIKYNYNSIQEQKKCLLSTFKESTKIYDSNDKIYVSFYCYFLESHNKLDTYRGSSELSCSISENPLSG